MNLTSRFTKLLGECRRQMNGAVAASMRYYGADYGLNYGVSLPTIRSLAEAEGKDHAYAIYLYQQQVREIRLASLHIAEAAKITNQAELDGWASGIINSEVAEEAAFALFQDVEVITHWLDSDNALLFYTALLSISRCKTLEVDNIKPLITKAIGFNAKITTAAIIIVIESYYSIRENRTKLDEILRSLPQCKVTAEIREEIEWRCAEY